MRDKIVRGMTDDLQIRFHAVDATAVVQEAVNKHALSITGTILLGRMLAAGLLMSSDMKSEDNSLTLKVHGDGPIGGGIVVGRSNHRVKGYIYHPEIEVPLDAETGRVAVGKAVGAGILTVIKDLDLKEPFSGQVELTTGEIGDDLTYYYYQSEQIPSAVGLGVLVEPDGRVRQAGGFIVQVLPQAPEQTISTLEQNIAQMPNVTDLLDMGLTIEEILAKFLLKGISYSIMEEGVPQWECNCSKDRFRSGLKMLGMEELEEMLEIGAETECHFCSARYHFTSEEIKGIQDELEQEQQTK